METIIFILLIILLFLAIIWIVFALKHKIEKQELEIKHIKQINPLKVENQELMIKKTINEIDGIETRNKISQEELDYIKFRTNPENK